MLAGRETTGGDPAAAREAQAVRRALLATKPDKDASEFDVESGAQNLLFRLRRENLLYRKKTWHYYGGLAIAATIVLAIGIVTLQPPVDDIPVYRGPGSQIITAPDTENLAASLSAEIETLGIKPKVTRFGATFTITAEWPTKPEAKHMAFLKRHTLQQPASGPLVIELTPGRQGK